MDLLRLMIVDDDEFIRVRLREMIPLESLGLEICCEADEGIGALALFRQYHPNIVILDIEIPLMNGLDLAKVISEEDKDVHIIIITGYGTMDFARAAIRTGTEDFLLKPIRQEEIVAALRRSISALEETAAEKRRAQQVQKLLDESLPLLRERYLIKLLDEGTEESEAECRSHLERVGVSVHGPLFCTALLVPDYSQVSSADWEVAQIAIQNISSEICAARKLDSMVFFDSMQRSILIAQGSASSLNKELEEALLTLKEKMNLYFSYGFSAGVGSVVDSLLRLFDSFRDANKAFGYKNTFGRNGICSIENVFSMEKSDSTPVHAEMDKVFNCLLSGEKEAALAALKHFFGVVVGVSGGSEGYMQWTLIEFSARLFSYIQKSGIDVSDLSADEIYAQITQASNPFMMQKRIYDLFSDTIARQQEKRSTRSAQLVRSACQYIDENCQKPELSLSEASASVGLSNVYFCSLFKKETGLTFTDYLNSARIEKAKKLLMNAPESLKIYDVAEKVGYTNPKYFYQVFKKLTGQRPKQFSEEHTSAARPEEKTH